MLSGFTLTDSHLVLIQGSSACQKPARCISQGLLINPTEGHRVALMSHSILRLIHLNNILRAKWDSASFVLPVQQGNECC